MPSKRKLLKDEACGFKTERGIVNPKCPKCLEKWNEFLDKRKAMGKPVRVVF